MSSLNIVLSKLEQKSSLVDYNLTLQAAEYHGSLKLIVAIPPINEAEYVIIKNRMNDINLFLSIIILYISSWKIKKLFG